MLTVTIREERGRCRWCGCTEYEPCEGGCGWATGQGTLCTACVGFDREIKTTDGRARLVAIVNDWRTDQALRDRPVRRTTTSRGRKRKTDRRAKAPRSAGTTARVV